jgi:hypothetical protein
MRLVFRITAGGDGFRAQGFSIDQGGQPIPVSVTQEGAGVRFAMVAAADGWRPSSRMPAVTRGQGSSRRFRNSSD